MADRYRTLAARSRHEIDKISGSRFIATVAPAATREEAEAVVADVRRELHDARHTCFAWRLGSDGGSTRAADDGEPHGSAGRPILQQLEARELTDVVAAVTRYFGGTKLGVGGLVRAYGRATAEALDRAEVREVRVTRRLVLEHAWESTGAVQDLLGGLGLEPRASDFGERVRLTLDVPAEEVERLRAALRDRTAGEARLTEG